LISHLGECRRRLSELRGRQDYLAISCAMLRAEGAAGMVLLDHPFRVIWQNRPYYEVGPSLGYGDCYTIAFYPVTQNIEVDRIPAALAPVNTLTSEIIPLLRQLPRATRERLQLPESENWWRIVFHLAWHFPRPFLQVPRRRWLAKDGAPHTVSDETFVQ